jgi:glycosyltransferase involved in cell wall biosynthesis
VLAPRVYRHSRYVTVSEATRDELAGLGISPDRVAVVRNGLDPVPPTVTPRAGTPRLVVLGRLVPHKRVEHALEVVARLRSRWPGLRLAVVGEGWWEEHLRAEAERLGVTDLVEFTGHVDEQAKHEQLAGAWLQLCPSVKEGWGLVVTEAGAHGTPTVGYRSSGGLRESVVDGRTGVLVDDLEEMVAAVDRLLADDAARREMGEAAADYAATCDWAASVRGFAGVLAAAAGGSAAVAVDHDVDGLLVGLLHGGVVRVGHGGDAGHGGRADAGTTGGGDQDGDQGLHSVSRSFEGRRRSGTVDAVITIHNTDHPTVPSATA